MKLPIAVLPSILFTCSVTIATPVIPGVSTSVNPNSLTVFSTAATNVKSISMEILNFNGVTTVNLDEFTAIEQGLIKNYAKKKKDHQKTQEILDSVKNTITDQKERVAGLNEKYQQSMRKPREKHHGLKHKDKLKNLKPELEAQSSELAKLQKQKDVLESKYSAVSLELTQEERKVVLFLFGRFINSLSIRLYVYFESGLFIITLDYMLYDTMLNSQLELEGKSASQSLTYDGEMENFDTQHPPSEETHIPIAEPVRATSSIGKIVEYLENLF
ncbi:hypothetical protein BATDEDRAFT_25686 [Batrachochytrium dendrobatidis JAM81]|uniref:Uncharacterized protein n=2 Tax=Batrachochytrium dendrobatidis TaxID=109871 RepID=F4P5A8_BATDJ|nr:uncharacterized protein BATDEDRAFT_25686 [Batrachochytrium dendrobatidis JAM81]EGF79163.1 hypothetical protein BATDEDRAFT_25686 [Batrachochytrium dendrobatidis JAM81]KAK5668145.1 hypothetical protein QVD99_005184 [Batrachochytrium dendrobatidis]OAJ43868.1 hypothetical protein BDEG_27181 [Batrachochytrium dendrobatidis JEL423]|eukprot:XP_006679850.1 hypothetical protein BATDEDRAFT_25686 [Batrachochytrium dendrobatidis JAM81]